MENEIGSPPQHEPFTRYWIGLTAILILCGTALFLGKTGDSIVNSLVDAFKPKVNSTTVVNSFLNLLTNQTKLVVTEAEFTVEVVKESEASLTVWKIEIPRGTTKVRLKAMGNRVQYFVPLSGLTESDLTYDDAKLQLTINAPAPVLDKDMVDVQTDPAMLELFTDVGLLRLDSRSGKFLRDEAQRDLRDAVITEASKAHYLRNAERDTVEALRTFLQPVTHAIQSNITITIKLDPNKRG